jgi:hypothetical protein
MKTRNLFTFLLVTTCVGNSLSQCLEITCPNDTIFQAPNDACESVFNYSDPVGTDVCVTITDTFNFTGAEQSFTVPSGIDTLYVELYGAQGNSNAGGIQGGFGGYAEGKILVNAGDELFIYVGDGGNLDQYGGFNGGGDAGLSPSPNAIAGGGGGASDIRIGGNGLVERIIVAAGGAGAGGNRVAGGSRGTGGGGGAGYYGGGGGAGWPGNSGYIMALGGTQAGGGTAGTSSWDITYNGFPGALGVGGEGGMQPASGQSVSVSALQGASGGGQIGAIGTYAGSFTGGSGAGGSSYISGVIDGVTQSGLQTGAGKVILKWNGAPATTTMISGLSNGDIFPSGTTTNTFEVNDGGGNTETCSFNVTVLPNIDTSVNVNGATLEAQNSNANYQWIDCTTNDAITNEISQLYQPTVNGTYAVIIDQGGCIDTSSCYQITTVGLATNNINNSFSVYPNPTSSNVTIALNTSDLTGTILVYTTDGKTVLNKSFENKSVIDLSIPGNAGVYFVQIFGKDFSHTERVIKR